jgi:large subunit ribosomal protein L25
VKGLALAMMGPRRGTNWGPRLAPTGAAPRHESPAQAARYHHSAVMATAQGTALAVERREVAGSRAARRLRRTGNVPGVVYGGGEDPVAFQVDARLLRHTLAHSHAVIELSLDGATGTPVVVKEIIRHPVSGETIHIDMLRVRLDQAISATVVLDLVGAEDAPGVKEGGVLEQVTRELNIEALPGDIPDLIQYDVSGVQIGDTITLDAVTPPRGVTLTDDPETVVATVTPPKLQLEEEETIEEETELVAEGETGEEAEAEAEESAGGDTGDGGEGGAEGE